MLSETVTRKGENALTDPKRLAFKPITGLPSEDVHRKGENALTERKHSTKRRNRVYGARTSLAKAKTVLSSKNVVVYSIVSFCDFFV